MGSWAQHKLEDAGKGPVLKALFGDSLGKSAGSAVDLYQGEKSVIEHAFDAINAGVNYVAEGAGGSEAQAAMDKFWDKELPNDVSNIILPSSLEDVVPHAKKLYDTVKGALDGVDASIESAKQNVSATLDRVGSYFSATDDYGLEPGSDDAKVAQTAAQNSDLVNEAMTEGLANTGPPTSLADLLAQTQSDVQVAQAADQRRESQSKEQEDADASVEAATSAAAAGEAPRSASQDANQLASELVDWDSKQTGASAAANSGEPPPGTSPSQTTDEDLARTRAAADRAEREAAIDSDLAVREARVQGQEDALRTRASRARTAIPYSFAQPSQGSGTGFGTPSNTPTCANESSVNSVLQGCLARLKSVTGSCASARIGAQCMRQAQSAASGCATFQSQLQARAQSYEATARSICAN